MKLTKALLEKVSARVLADTAFLMPEPLVTDPPPASRWSAIGVRILFSGPVRGYVEVWTPRAIARRLAANMLGRDISDPDVEENELDALMETVNIICGNLLLEVAGRDPIFHLGTPRTCRRLVPFTQRDPGTDVWLSLEGEALLVRMRVAAEKTRAA